MRTGQRRIGSRRVALVLAASGVALLGSVATGHAQAADRQVYEAELTSQQAGSPTGLRQRIRYVNPDDPEAKPPAVAEVIFRLPAGAGIDTTVPGQCQATELEFQLQGQAACPPDSRVGSGSLSADTGVQTGVYPRVVETAVTFFNNRDELILFAESTNTPGPPIRVASRIEIQDRSFISRVPPLPGAPPPDPFLALREVFNHLEPIEAGDGAGRAAYLRAPDTCPADGHWTITATFTYRDGVSQAEESRTPCTVAHSGQAEGQPAERTRAANDKRQGRRGGRQTTAPPVPRTPVGGVETGMGGLAGGGLLARAPIGR